MNTPLPVRWWLPIALLALIVPAAHAEFIPVERFDSLLLGPIDGQDGWVAASDSSAVAVDPLDFDNQLLSILSESTTLHRPLVISSGSTRMIFLRFQAQAQLSLSFGLSDLVSPTRFDHFEVELSITNSPMELRINEDGTYRALTSVIPGVWYNCWLSVDNARDSTAIWMHDRPGQPAVETDRLRVGDQDRFAFRNGAAGDLQTFYVKTGGGNGVAGPLLLDDLFVEDAEGALNLSNPVGMNVAVEAAPLPSAIALEAPSPNPLRVASALRFALPAATDVDLSVFDAAGRRVATLHRGTLPAGRHEVAWDGRGDTGAPVGAGVYFVRLVAGSAATSRRLLRL
jgi:hypothetical protein